MEWIGALVFGALLVLGMLVVLMSVIADFLAARRKTKTLAILLTSDDPLDAAFRAGGPELAARIAFCRLYTGHCLQVLEKPSPGGKRRRYRLCEGVDPALMHPIERAIAGLFADGQAFHQIIDGATGALAGYAAGSASIATGTRAAASPDGTELARRLQELLKEMRATDPPEHGPCGV